MTTTGTPTTTDAETTTGEPTTTEPTTTGPTTTEPTTTEPTTTEPTTTEEPTTTGEPDGLCCMPLEIPGCEDPGIEACVCAQDPFCCEQEWDGLCVLHVENFRCGVCEYEPCCLPHGSTGCEEPGLEACVCDDDPYCCETAWDEICVQKVNDLGCGICELPPSGACCTPHGGLGCDEPEVQACVCDTSPECCDGGWDESCVEQVTKLGCGICEMPPEAACCEAHGGLGCDEPEVATCVCNIAPGCCDGGWDEICVGLVEFLGCGSCEAGGASCCEAQEEPMCEDDEVMACVCAQDPFCCEVEWDGTCVEGVEAFGCGICGGGGASCCEPQEEPFCEDDEVTACVCAQDSFCCEVAWDIFCVEGVEAFGCGICG